MNKCLRLSTHFLSRFKNVTEISHLSLNLKTYYAQNRLFYNLDVLFSSKQMLNSDGTQAATRFFKNNFP